MKQTQSSWRDFDGAGKLVMKKSSVIDCLANFSVGERTLPQRRYESEVDLLTRVRIIVHRKEKFGIFLVFVFCYCVRFVK